MQSIMKTSCLLAAGLLVFAAGIAEAGEVDVKVPFQFVVHGQMMPAGQYHVQSDALDPSVIVIRGEKGIRAAVVVLTMPAAGHDPGGDKPALTFARHETQYQLTDIWESRSEGREIAGQ